MVDYLAESIKTIKNLCEIALLLRQLKQDTLLPTILEIIHLESQNVIDENCIEDKE